MKITVNTKEIQTAFKNLLKLAPVKSSVPILSNILIIADSKKVELTATDIDTTIHVILKNAEVIETGSYIIPRDTIKLVQKLNDTYITISENNIESGKRNVKYQALSTEMYPEKQNFNFNQHAFTLSRPQMSEILPMTYACSTMESTPILKGVLFRNTNVVATDRHRMALRTLESNDYTHDMVIPSNAIDLIQTFTEKQYKGEYSFIVDEYNRFVNIQFDNVTMIVRLCEGTYPDVSKIIPRTFNTEITVNKKDLIEELTVMKEVTDKTNTVKMNISSGSLKLSASNDTTSNQLESTLDAKQVGDDMRLACNLEFILEALKNKESEKITIKLNGSTVPFMIDADTLILPHLLAA
ncbi:DNA polymerase III subunit beta [Paenibacillus xylaniclasticus]|uniref:DNA polymerase III subunit beta n=1 Tax=Paenibacillus xylaniclasticus TaxID=588083 RepID=UPI0013DEB419|nr:MULTISPECIES: DNA polymerase III subunit beta [Paenibacillus]GFN32551.1 DNA polymerase III subunit beta [Paenibacillus curdlanolyticus]